MGWGGGGESERHIMSSRSVKNVFISSVSVILIDLIVHILKYQIVTV